MPATLIDGKAHAAELTRRVASSAAVLSATGRRPGLAVVLVGEDPASEVYVRNKGIAAGRAGFHSIERRLPSAASQGDVIAIVKALNADPDIDGILVQLPLPAHIDAACVISEISPEKDVDGLTEINVGRLSLGRRGLTPCTPQGAVMLLKSVHGSLSGKDALVVGRSLLVGKPLAIMLLAEDCTVTVAHSQSRDLPALCARADILCSAIGRPGFIPGHWIKTGATVIDIGISRHNGRLFGDVDYATAVERAGALTPVPGGVGPMTIACLLRNAIIAAARRRGLEDPEI